MTSPPAFRPLLAEFLGTGFLLAAIVGSGAMAERLTDDVGLQLLQNAVATAGVLVAVILTFGPVSGAHLNPAVTASFWLLDGTPRRTAVAYAAVQLVGAVTGAVVANAMFGLDVVRWSTNDRSGAELALAEGVATLGLLLVVHGVSRTQSLPVVAVAVGGYIAGAFAFTSSTSFANPAVTLARMVSDSFAGITPGSVPAFFGAQVLATVLTVVMVRILFPRPPGRDPGGPVPAEVPSATP